MVSSSFWERQSYGANFTIDGQRSNGGIFGDHSSTQPSLEAVDAVNVLSNTFSAEYAGINNVRIPPSAADPTITVRFLQQ